ncbi:LacI family DNA-binding transcriptional regulator [Kutzneria kofuensis]|uniref:LacI family DNA-binding transcriptional regulator n=1 Tax=Kutzneria kofuensis TaxID=103725 RepID=UPI003CD088FE
MARTAGVSPATASRVLNGFHQVRPETRRQVENAMAELAMRDDGRRAAPSRTVPVRSRSSCARGAPVCSPIRSSRACCGVRAANWRRWGCSWCCSWCTRLRTISPPPRALPAARQRRRRTAGQHARAVSHRLGRRVRAGDVLRLSDRLERR